MEEWNWNGIDRCIDNGLEKIDENELTIAKIF